MPGIDGKGDVRLDEPPRRNGKAYAAGLVTLIAGIGAVLFFGYRFVTASSELEELAKTAGLTILGVFIALIGFLLVSASQGGKS